MLASLKQDLEISEELVKQDAISSFEMEKTKYTHDSMANKVKETEQWLIQAQADLKESQQRRDEFAGQQPYNPSVDSALAVLNQQIKVQERMIEHFMSQCQAMVLKSPVDGIVSQIQKGPGETVIAGEPVITVIEQSATDIVAYVNQDQLIRVKERMPVQLVKNGKPVQVAGSQITRLGPGVELIPQQLWQDPRAEEWGRAVYIKIPPNLKLVPGETVGIRGL
jgi:multidrug resistance efflux pump